MKTRIVSKRYVVPVYLMCILLMSSSCDEEDRLEIEYPTTGFYGDNILLKHKMEYSKRANSLQAKVPVGQKLKVIITAKTPKVSPNAIEGGVWWISSQRNNLAVFKFDLKEYSQVFESVDGGLTCVQEMFFDTGTFQIDYYENDALTPTDSKTIVVSY
jgi:hypothetical protein